MAEQHQPVAQTVSEQLRAQAQWLKELIDGVPLGAIKGFDQELFAIANEVEGLETTAAALREALADTQSLAADIERLEARGAMLREAAEQLHAVLLERLRRAEAERDELRRLLQQQYDRARTESPANATCDNDGGA